MAPEARIWAWMLDYGLEAGSGAWKMRLWFGSWDWAWEAGFEDRINLIFHPLLEPILLKEWY